MRIRSRHGRWRGIAARGVSGVGVWRIAQVEGTELTHSYRPSAAAARPAWCSSRPRSWLLRVSVQAERCAGWSPHPRWWRSGRHPMLREQSEDYSARMTWALDANTMLAQTATRESAIPAAARYARMANNADPIGATEVEARSTTMVDEGMMQGQRLREYPRPLPIDVR